MKELVTHQTVTSSDRDATAVALTVAAVVAVVVEEAAVVDRALRATRREAMPRKAAERRWATKMRRLQ